MWVTDKCGLKWDMQDTVYRFTLRIVSYQWRSSVVPLLCVEEATLCVSFGRTVSEVTESKVAERRVKQKDRTRRTPDLLGLSSLCLTSGVSKSSVSLCSLSSSLWRAAETQQCMNKRVGDKREVLLQHFEALSGNYKTLAHSRSIFLPLKHSSRSRTNILWQFVNCGLQWWLYCP